MGEKNLKRRCLIFGGGEILDYEAVKARLYGDEFILCADSGFLHCGRLNLTPGLLLGDFDSAVDLPDLVERICYPHEKDYTDSTLAVREAVKRGYKSLMLAGMLGGRFDHSLANLQNLAWCVRKGIDAYITDGRTDVFVIHNSSLVLPRRESAYFSLLSLTGESSGVTITGAKYPLVDYSLTCDIPRAVSNEFLGRDVKITVKKGLVAVVVCPFHTGTQ